MDFVGAVLRACGHARVGGRRHSAGTGGPNARTRQDGGAMKRHASPRSHRQKGREARYFPALLKSYVPTN